MNIQKFMESASRMANKALFKIKKHSPEILMAVGTVCIVTGTVTACKATLKLPDITEEAGDLIDKIHGAEEGTVKIKEGETYSEEDATKDLRVVYIQTAVKVVKLYAMPTVLVAGGLGCMFGSHIIMRKRNAAAVAAYAAVSKAFAEYKERVKERFGDQVEHEIATGMKVVEVETGEVNEDGTPKKEKVTVSDKETDNPFSVLFDLNNAPSTWQNDAEYNRMIVNQAEIAANAKLKRKGYLFLNDVYDMLGIKGTKIGQFAGWVYSDDNPTCVDFGLTRMDDPELACFLKGAEKNVWLVFNCESNIVDKI